MKFLYCTLLLLSLAPSLRVAAAASAEVLAHRCVSITAAMDQALRLQGQGSYRWSRSDTAAKAYFRLQPASLEHFLLYDQNRRYLRLKGLSLKAESNATKANLWSVHQVAGGFYRLKPHRLDELADGTRQGHQDEQALTGKLRLNRESDELCQDYPEAALDVLVDAPGRLLQDVSQPLRGYADVHTHIAFPAAMAGKAMAGGVFHPLGIEHALHDCEGLHGEGGNRNLLEFQRDNDFLEAFAEESYETAGYPDFPFWPNRETSTHVQAYYKWIERAFYSGLRLMVTSVTGNPTFCHILGIVNLETKTGPCDGSDALRLQTDYIYALQDYIDAQNGGAGRGWFRIVTSPRAAREVIAAGKLAVVLGIEHGTLFDCDDSPGSNCDRQHIEKSLDELHALGIRSVYPIHRFDNAFGGAKLQEGAAGAWMNVASKLATSQADGLLDLLNPKKMLFRPLGGYYMAAEICRDGYEGAPAFKSMDDFIVEDFSFVTDTLAEIPVVGGLLNRLLKMVLVDKLQPLPDYREANAENRVCNPRGLTEKGRWLIEGLMDRGMMVEIDHMSVPTLEATLTLLEARNYSGVISSHSWLEMTPRVYNRIFALGGMIAPMKESPRATVQRYQEQMQMMAQYPFGTAIALGTDIQGVHSQPAADPETDITYPFAAIDGSSRFLPPRTGNRLFSYADEGMAHYGLLAEWFQTVRQQDTSGSTVTSLMKSAEAYLQMWERAEASGS